MESDEEWAMNKKLINLGSKDVRKSVSIPSSSLVMQSRFLHVNGSGAFKRQRFYNKRLHKKIH